MYYAAGIADDSLRALKETTTAAKGESLGPQLSRVDPYNAKRKPTPQGIVHT